MLQLGTRFSKGQLHLWKRRDRQAIRTRCFVREPAPSFAVRSAKSWAAARRAAYSEQAMTILKWALIFFVVSVIAGLLGFTGISAASADVARFLFYVFVVIFLVLLILGLTIFRV
jgi:uncharacterized membrane protein YtjA (UPF0391 family)